jgi:hypothetical protein
VLTLSEFKAILAHEFGHFAQGGTRLGSYVYAAYRILFGLAAGRGWLERGLLDLRAQPGLSGAIGWAGWGVVFALRQAVTGLFYGINVLHASLKREMEFHADLVAVSVAGSEAAVRGLARADFAQEALEAAIADLALAAEHGRYSQDLFVHQRDAMDYLRRQRQDPNLGEPPPMPDDPALAPEVFEPDDKPPPMWADHPSNYDREQNVKRHYVRCPLDGRPAWVLFDDAAEARELVTWRLYRAGLRVPRSTELGDPEAVRTFVLAERRAVTYDPRYHGLYDHRFIEPGDLDDLARAGDCEVPAPAVLRQRHAALYGGPLEERVKAYHRHIDERKQILAYDREARRGKKGPLELRGRRYGPDDVNELLEFLGDRLDKDQRLLAETDRAAFLVHYQMSRQLGPAAVEALKERYAFHLGLQRILRKLFDLRDKVESALVYCAGRCGGLSMDEFQQLILLLRGVRDHLLIALEDADGLRLPPLPNLKAGARVGPMLWDGPVVRHFVGEGWSVPHKRIRKLYGQLVTMIDRAERLHFKSLGGVLTLQEEVGRRWLARFGGDQGAEVAAAADERG